MGQSSEEIPFDSLIERSGSGCLKYDQRLSRFGRADIMPLWVADMDFAAPAAVRQALAQRLAHPVFGYSLVPDGLYEHLYGWFARRHGWILDPAQVQLAPGVVPSLFASIQTLSQPGDGVLVPSPVYPPFLSVVEHSGRRLVQSPLIESAQGFGLDFDHLERQAAGARMLLLCSPHNPVGRIWHPDELTRLIELALRHRLVVVSDEIHCDLSYPDNHPDKRHHCLPTLAPPELRLVTTVSPSKTFNIPGLNLSALVVAQANDRRALEGYFQRQHLNPGNPLSMAAFSAAYASGDAWLDGLRHYLAANRQQVADFLESQPGSGPRLRAHLPQASALVWLDCRELGLDNQGLKDFFVQQAGLGLNDGASFGVGGEGFMRLNIGTQKAWLEQALAQLQTALAQFSKEM